MLIFQNILTLFSSLYPPYQFRFTLYCVLDPASNPALIDSSLQSTITCTLLFGKTEDGSDKESIADNLTDFEKSCHKAAPKSKKIYLFRD